MFAASGSGPCPGPGTLIGFRRDLHAEVAGNDRVYLFVEDGLRVLRGVAVAMLAPLLDGTRDLLPDPRQRPTQLADLRPAPTSDIAGNVAGIRARLESEGMETLVLDQTRPDVALPVVKVIVPGLRHFWARFAPGRLYDSPVKLGRQARPTAYADLNPAPMFL